MRILSEIIEDTKLGGKPDYEELRYAMLALLSLHNMNHICLQDVLTRAVLPEALRGIKLENSFHAYKTALNKSPKEWLGWSNDPDNPEYQRFMKLGNGLLDKVLHKMIVED